MILSDGTVISMSLQVLFLWSLITILGFLTVISLCVCVCLCICISQSIVVSSFSVTIAGSCSYQLSDTGCYSAEMLSKVYMLLPCCVFGCTQFLQVQDS